MRDENTRPGNVLPTLPCPPLSSHPISSPFLFAARPYYRYAACLLYRKLLYPCLFAFEFNIYDRKLHRPGCLRNINLLQEKKECLSVQTQSRFGESISDPWDLKYGLRKPEQRENCLNRRIPEERWWHPEWDCTGIEGWDIEWGYTRIRWMYLIWSGSVYLDGRYWVGREEGKLYVWLRIGIGNLGLAFGRCVVIRITWLGYIINVERREAKGQNAELEVEVSHIRYWF